MEQKRQCPQCGQYVAADRTYCLNCGVTLGNRCPSCRGVAPLGAKTCPACGHSFVQKRKKLQIPLWVWMKKHARPLALGLPALLLLLSLVAAAFPAVSLTVLKEDKDFLSHAVTGFALAGDFLGGSPASVEGLLSLKELAEEGTALRVLLFLQGLGLLAVWVGLSLSVTLAAVNYRRWSRVTATRMLPPLGAALGGSALLFGVSPAIAGILRQAMALYAEKAEEGYTVDTATLWPLLLLIAVTLSSAVYLLLYFAVYSKNRTEEDREDEELSLARIFAIPVGALARIVHRVTRAIRKRAGKVVSSRDEPTLTVTPRFSTYVGIFIAALVFTQALLSKVSNIFFWFIFLLPLVLLVYVLLCKGALSVSMLSDTVTIEKNTPYTYEFRIDNHSPLAIPFLEAQVSIPQSNSVRCTERTVRISLAPMTGYHLKNTVRFRFRGTYDIGVTCFYVYDFFRIFRVRVDVDTLTTVYVLPRRLTLEDASAHSVSDDTARTVRSPLAVDKLEISDIRDYQMGDSLKSIHWKLSSKSENFIVKDYNTGTSNQTVIYCDLTPHFADEPPKGSAKANAGETAPSHGDGKNLTRAEKRERRKAERERRKQEQKEKEEMLRREADLRRKSRRIKENADTRAISDEELQARLDQRNAVADTLAGDEKPAQTPTAEETLLHVETVDVHELAKPAYYEDMNEYLADGVVELTIASVLAELRRGRDVLLLWFDRRSDTGVFAYPLRGIDEFENIYHLFATAPLCDPARKVTTLSAMVSDAQSIKQTFVLSTLDSAMLSDLAALPGVSDAGSFGSAEVVLYNPEERFRYPRDRANYLEGCREQLAASGLSLTAGSFHITQSTPTEGGRENERTE